MFISLLKPESTFEVVLDIVLSICNFSPLSCPWVRGRYTHPIPPHSFLIPSFILVIDSIYILHLNPSWKFRS